MKLKRVGILTGGGDVPGLNSCVRAFTLRAADDGIEVLGIRRGWSGILEVDPARVHDPDDMTPFPSLLRLGRETVRTVGRHGGTFLHTSRTNPAAAKRSELPEFLRASAAAGANATESAGATSATTPRTAGDGAAGGKAGGKGEGRGKDKGEGKVDVTPHVLRVLESLRIDALVAVGGDDTLSYAVRLDREGYPVLAVPKTMDNDVPGTDYCIGFSTAITRSVDFLIQLRTPAGSHERIAVLELFGRYCGETALFTGYLGSADRTVISEVPFDIDRLSSFLAADQDANPSHYAILVISEGAVMDGGERVQSGEPDAYGHRKLGGIGDAVASEIERRTGRQTLIQRLAYLMRSGPPDSLDRLVATNFGNLAYDRLSSGKRGEMVAIRNGCYTLVPVETAISGKRKVDVASQYDSERYVPRLSHVLGLPMFLT